MLQADVRQSTRRSLSIGVIVSGALLAAVAAGKAPFGVIEIFFLVAPLVVVPLGLELGDVVAPARWHWPLDAARMFQPVAAILVVASFWLPQGRVACALAIPWVVVCFLVALAGLSSFRLRGQTISAIAVNLSRIDLAVAAGWLLVSRLGLQPMGFREPIILLTAVHFHYTGFATALLVGAMLDFAQHHGHHSRFLTLVATLTLLLPFLLAVGFVFSPAIKVVAALLLALTLVTVAFEQVRIGRATLSWHASVFLWISSTAVVIAMTLAGVYALGEFLGKDWILIPRMAATHGLLNALGFVLPGLVGWLLAHSEKPQPRPSKVLTRFEKAATVWFPDA